MVAADIGYPQVRDAYLFFELAVFLLSRIAIIRLQPRNQALSFIQEGEEKTLAVAGHVSPVFRVIIMRLLHRLMIWSIKLQQTVSF